jgi:hypothetical protein
MLLIKNFLVCLFNIFKAARRGVGKNINVYSSRKGKVDRGFFIMSSSSAPTWTLKQKCQKCMQITHRSTCIVQLTIRIHSSPIYFSSAGWVYIYIFTASLTGNFENLILGP